MLTYFSVEGYRNFATKLEWDLADTKDYRFNTDALIRNGSSSCVKCALLYGKNAVGKSNFGNALFDIQSTFGLLSVVRDKGNYLNADVGNDEARFEYHFDFSGNTVVYEYSKQSYDSMRRERLIVNDATIFDYNHQSHRMLENRLDLIGAETLNWEFLNEGMSVASYICNNTPFERLGSVGSFYMFVRGMGLISDSYLSNRAFVANIVDLILKSGLIEELEAFLRYFGIEESLRVHQSASGDQVLYFEHSRPIAFAENCSSGTVALLRLFNYFNRIKHPSLLFIDEFDAFYHYDLSEKVVSYIKERAACQVVCASHNTDLFSNKVMRPDCLFILSKRDITSAANATKRELREGHNLEKLYKAGEFYA